MRVNELHDWQLSFAQIVELQRRLATQVCRTGEIDAPQFIAAVDVSVGRGKREGSAAVVVFSYPALSLVETKIIRDHLDSPYIPRLLPFRELPLILEAFAELTIVSDLTPVDGQGMAHQRRFGLASHPGLFLNKLVIGYVKSLLCGSYAPLADEPGSYSDIIDKGEVISAALRTRFEEQSVYVSTGHQVGLEIALLWVSNCCRGYRLPEPLRTAHRMAGEGLAVAG